MSEKKQPAIPFDNFGRPALSYDLTAQLYADLREAQSRSGRIESFSRQQTLVIEELQGRLAALSAELESQKAESSLLKEKGRKWDEEKRRLTNALKRLEKDEQKAWTARNELQEKLNRIKEFHSYKVGQRVADAQKKWGSLIGGALASWSYYRSCRQNPSAEGGAPAPLSINDKLLAKNLRAEDLNFAKPRGARLKIAAIMDDFTRECFKGEADFEDLRPESWEERLEAFKPDLIFIESAWLGKDESWRQLVSNFSRELQQLMLYAREKGIPTAFWNKEDPVHYSTFLPLAKSACFIFTTDIDCVPMYKKDAGHDRVYFLPFAAQPRLHNPLEKFERKDAFCFAGSYYLRYPERQRDFDALAGMVEKASALEIFDRNYGREHPHYIFPERYQKHIQGGLPYEEIDRAYKGYRFGVNMNSIKQSQSMFARRVYELMASNTMVVSNFSRGLRNFFGDLAISSDNPGELERRIRPYLKDPVLYKKHRLLALRKVMSGHTYKRRLEYLKSKIWSLAPPKPEKILMLAECGGEEELNLVCESFVRQDYPEKELLVIGLPEGAARLDIPWLSYAKDIEEARGIIEKSGAGFIGGLSPRHFYGAPYLTDLSLASQYSQSSAFGKASHYEFMGGRPVLINDGQQYREGQRLLADRSIARRERLDEFLAAFTGGGALDGLAADEFNFVAEGNRESREALKEALDLEGVASGLDLEKELLPFAESLEISGDQSQKYDDTVIFDAKRLSELYQSARGAKLSLEGGSLKISSSLKEDQHVYIGNPVFRREELNLKSNNIIRINYKGALDLRIAFIFLNAEKEKISHIIAKAGSSSLIIPDKCVFVQLRMRVKGPGSGALTNIVFGQDRDDPEALLCRSGTLIIGKNYPSYEDLYKYGFVHARVLAYRKSHGEADIYRVQPQRLLYSEFENVNIAMGDARELERTLASGLIKTAAVHLIDPAIWRVLQKFANKIKIVIWIHGAEIQHWKRREFDFELMSADEIEKQKRRTEAYLKMWRDILDFASPNISYVFISENFRRESEEDVGRKFPEESTHIIHNYIDTDFFSYEPKDPAQRFNVLTIRPFASKKYAMDLAVKAILKVSESPEFSKFTFTICGDGPLFDETVEPLRKFPNVILERRFLNREEMRQKYKENGVCLMPTRMDAQGVSRDEAMSCGLAPITNSVCAIPEFVDEECGFLAGAEDAESMAAALLAMAADENLFLKKSAAAARKVRELSGYDQTIKRELDLLRPQGE